MVQNLIEKQLIEAYGFVFSKVHSDGFKISEMKSLLFDSSYWFMEKPNNNWFFKLMNYLVDIEFDLSNLDMNRELWNTQFVSLKPKKIYTDLQVIGIINELLQRPDILIDSVQNENTEHDAKSLFELVTK